MSLRNCKEFLSLLKAEFPPKENCNHALHVKDSSIHIQIAFPSELIHLILYPDEEEFSTKFLLEKIRAFLDDKGESLFTPHQKEKDSRQLSFDF